VSSAIPAGATDCHMHLFEARYPLSPNRPYTPGPAPLDQYCKVAAALRLTRAVVVQPSAYGTENSCTLDAVAALGASARAVVGIDRAASRSRRASASRRGSSRIR
jgi:D-galactarolactone isomerase